MEVVQAKREGARLAEEKLRLLRESAERRARERRVVMGFTMVTGKLHEGYTIPMLLVCPACGERHIDEGDFAEKAHHTHACQECGMVWRPAEVNTHGVRFLPGYKNGETQ